MSIKKLKDYLHLYLGCQCKGDEGSMIYTLIDVGIDRASLLLDRFGNECVIFDFKPILRPLSDLKAEDFYSFGLAGKGHILINATVNKMWCSGLYDVKEYDERIEDELSVDPNDLLYELEESDFENVLSCTKTGQIAYGTSDEMRYFVELETLSKWVNHLRKRQIDVDGLIKAGLAIDATTYAAQVSDTTMMP